MTKHTVIQRLQNIASFLKSAAACIDQSGFAKATILRETAYQLFINDAACFRR